MPQQAQPDNSIDHATPDHVSLLCAAGDISIIAAPGSKADGSDPKGSVGLPSFSMVAYTGGALRVEGWRHPVVVDLTGLSIPSQRRPIRFNHSAHQGIGHTERITVERGHLVAEGVVSRDTPAAREVVTSGRRGFPWQASLGASVQHAEFVRGGKFVTVNDRQFEGPVYVARRSTLGEISFVDLGADGDTAATIAATSPEHSNTTPNPETVDMPGTNSSNANTKTTTKTPDTAGQADNPQPTTPVNTPTQGAPGAGAAGVPGDTPKTVQAAAVTQPEPDSVPDPVAEMRARAAAEARRIAAVRKVCGDRHADIEAKAIGEGWDETRTELEVLRASRPSVDGAPMAFARGGDAPVDGAVLEAACILTAGIAKPEDHCDEKPLDIAARRFRGGIGLQELLLEAAWANGYTGRNFRASRDVLRFAFASHHPDGYPGVQAASFSTIDIGGILSNVANKFLLEGFFSVERTWRNIASRRNVSDFKTITSYRLIGKDQYEKVAPGGEIKHGTLGEEKYSNKADTYALMLSIDRRDVINDDLGAITTAPRKLGRGSGLKINDVFWAEFLDNGAFFTATKKNLLTGGDSVLNIDGLTAAEVAFLNQVDSDGKPIGVMPAIILVPTSLSAIATVLFKSLEIRTTAADQTYPVANPHAGKFRVEVSRYLSNSQYAGGSDTGWYLLADPADLPVIEVAFLNGQESPTIETAEADFNVLGIQMRGYHDFGVALQEPRGGIKNDGEVMD
ncbi:MAG: hypothetical protein GC159_17410 [Phycisphaera sp.]|nr:hypothetical protein [Phycisphaera sp.]